ncbi:MAG: hypothetical protein VZQ29_02740 [Succiniclasticum sp.]|nr:hypothetical protein [Succiniclasticum sp.]
MRCTGSFLFPGTEPVQCRGIAHCWFYLQDNIVEWIYERKAFFLPESMEEQGYMLDVTDQRFHHEIYLSDARTVAPEKLKTVIRHPIRKR